MDRHIQSAYALIERGLADEGVVPIVPFSGGKDSLVVSHLVRTVAPDIEHIYSDDEVLFPEHVSYIETMRDYLPLRIVQGGSWHAGWHHPWSELPYWRDWPDYMDRVDGGFDDRTHLRQWGYTLVYRGLRSQESRGRADRLATTHGDGMRGGCRVIDPIHDWVVEDVWAYIAEHRLLYCSVYDRMTDINVPIRHQRVGPLARAQGDILLRGWPSLYRDLIHRYGVHWQRPHKRNRYGIDPLIWIDIQKALSAEQ